VPLARHIPERQVDGTGGPYLRARAVEAEIGHHQMPRHRLDPPRIAADQPGCHLLMHHRLHGLGTTEGLAQPDQPLVGLDLDPDQVRPLRDADRAHGLHLRHGGSLAGQDDGQDVLV
jgi:hypothetical protein